MSSFLPGAAVRPARFEFPLVVAMATASFAGIWMAVPLAAILLQERGAAAVTVGAFGALSYAVAVVVTPLVPALARRIGLPRLHRAGVLLVAAALLGFFASAHIVAWFALALVFGAGACIAWTTSDALAAARVAGAGAGRRLGVYQTFISASIGVGPLLLQVTGPDHPRSFLAAIMLLAVGLCLSLLLGGGAAAPARVGPRRLLRLSRALPGALGLAMVAGGLEGVGGSVHPVFVLDLGLGPAMAAGVVAATGLGNVLLQIPAGLLCDRLGTARAAPLIALALAAVTLAWPALAGTQAVWPLLGAWGGLAGALYTVGMVTVARRFDGAARLAGLAALNTAYTLGGMALTPAAGLVQDLAPRHGLPLLVAGLALLLAATAARRR